MSKQVFMVLAAATCLLPCECFTTPPSLPRHLSRSSIFSRGDHKGVPGTPSGFSETPFPVSDRAVSLKMSEEDQGESTDVESLKALGPATFVATGTAPLLPFYFWSLYTLRTTGCGLPAGPFGLYGALEGFSYLAVVAMVGLSAYTKVKTGKGLPAGPGGFIGAVEGIAYLGAVAGLAVLALQVAQYGYIPNAVPSEGAVCS
uniref:Uncharacterized protein n=1 Tax=Chromera velia CCMP2878 TaxID=1169474 RepID=A0A0G4HCK4_9ALVE|mmetsp:Transcript_4254/g.8657  ORF Transcript_4254/g.8657 Transcript_4254/m.8657 type:complete len:202 (-) Transcript_4254:161-766(-)|eukprot:Cvel_6331.t1-p1 / transcript=Cvel_6331.t1 / gene=Cvel_6331 / organism=Chromera_velia_CCMP2878 / gene_product=hypothetical protein / transcript_product=hypothetical protein / location=Cvel_scaffold307:52984-53586(-) / protein_length=201 / sequence_SO=supercontig / SO=protein_coding / is_pseudo=false